MVMTVENIITEIKSIKLLRNCAAKKRDTSNFSNPGTGFISGL
jgi:hypothetical protein